MQENVLLPIPLVKHIVELLGYWDVYKCDRAVIDDYCDVLRDLNVKLQKTELRDAYSRMIAADSEDSRHDARIDYLWHKTRLNDIVTDGFIL